ncbi:hypothetical protein [Limnothrix redekei]|uniref:Uncharacterized protein n=1 Tax=Limnothrix redekei LRLZ20PSL1 TaxID=3112953 RepID=A0ABW7CAQ1_9CYAN
MGSTGHNQLTQLDNINPVRKQSASASDSSDPIALFDRPVRSPWLIQASIGNPDHHTRSPHPITTIEIS